jgi:DNA topoisomerase-3
MTTVILAEKPSQARAYAEAFAQSKKGEGLIYVADPILPRDTVITYGFGHLVELAMPEAYDPKYKRWAMKYLPIFPDSYKYFVPRDKQKQFKIVSSLLKKADTIVVATDSDRKGRILPGLSCVKAGSIPGKNAFTACGSTLWKRALFGKASRILETAGTSLPATRKPKPAKSATGWSG